MASPNDTRAQFGLPILSGVLPINRTQIPAEIVAGITLAALAIPEVMGYTKIAGTPVISGLYTILIPMALFACLASSRHLVVGADSATAAILASGMVGLAATGTDEYLALAGLLALMVGGGLVVASLIGLGFMADFLSRTVLVGFLTGVGIQVALGQIGGMLDLPGHGLGTVQKIWEDIQSIGNANYASFAIALAVIAVIVGSKKISRKIPGAMIAVVGAIVASWASDLGTQMRVLGSIPSGLPEIEIPDVELSLKLVWSLAPTALAMLVVILAQSAATARAYAVRYDERLNETSDLVGLGIANIGAGLSGTFVVNGSPTKTQMVEGAGGRTQLSMLVTVAVVLLVLLFLTEPLTYMPEAVLSAIVFLIGIDLIDVKEMKRIYVARRSEFWVALVTALMVVFFGVEKGVIFAVLLSLVVHTRHGYRPKNSVLVRAAPGPWRARPLTSRAQAAPGLLIYRFAHGMYYANAERLSEEVLELVETADPPLRWFCIDVSAVDDVDYSAAATLRSLHQTLDGKGIRLVIMQVLDDDQDRIRGELGQLFDKDAFYDTLDEVVSQYDRQ
ncbi:MAG: SulP family inorganic anion transporter [Alphaproteobacteria bacterium]|nr:SulP family inorganic anion transporter [Alphaproteobacteria bacterium]